MNILTNGQLTAHISPQGAALMGLWHADYSNCLTISPADAKIISHEPHYCGALVGPVANRVSGAEVTIGNTRYCLASNEGPNTLHSGPDGLHNKLWSVVAQTDAHVTLEIELPCGDAGLPGNRKITVNYALEADGRLCLDIKASTNRVTVMNIAHHPYWNLDGSDTVACHRLQVAATQYTPTDRANLPTGKLAPVHGSPYDFRDPTPVTTAQTLDGNLCLAQTRRNAPAFAARLSAAGGPTLEIFTTEPGLQVYNGSGLSDDGTVLHAGQRFRPFAGIALEPQGWPNAANTDGFPSILLAPGHLYHQQTVYRISQ